MEQKDNDLIVLNNQELTNPKQKVNIELNKVHCMDCLEGLKMLPDNSVDLIVTDPPYGIGYKSNHGSKEYKKRVQNTDWDISFDFSNFFDEFYRVLKNDSYMYVWGRFENYETMKKLGMCRVLIWDKDHCGMGDLTDWGIGYELVYVFKKGKPKLIGGRTNGVFKIQHIGFFDKTLHPTQKPVKVIKHLLNKSSKDNDIVLDGFMGSGTTAVACKQLNRRFIGFELEQKYVDICNKRLAQGNIKEWF